MTKPMVDELAHRVTIEQFEQRASKQRLTGEWVIYVRRAGQNFYLCCATHEAADDDIFSRIMEHCVRDFPVLPEWLAEQQA